MSKLGFQLPASWGSAASTPDMTPNTNGGLDYQSLLNFGGQSGDAGGLGGKGVGILDGEGSLGTSGIFNMKSFLGDATSKGWGGLALGAAGGAANLFMGMQQYGMAKDALSQAKDQFNKNYAAQQTTTNSALSDRQNARNAANPGAYQSTADYMAQNGIK